MLALHSGCFLFSAHSVWSLVGTRVSWMYRIWLMRKILTLAVVFRKRSEHELFMTRWFIQSSSFLFTFCSYLMSYCVNSTAFCLTVSLLAATHIAIRILNIHRSVVIGNEISICIKHLTGLTLEVWSSITNIIIGHCVWNTSRFFHQGFVTCCAWL